MITPMLKYSFLVFHENYQLFLEDLQKLGVLHIIECENKEDTEIRELEKSIANFEKAIKFLKSRNQPVNPSQKDDQTGFDILKEINQQQDHYEILKQQHLSIVKEIANIKPWGDFSLETIQNLKKVGVKLKLFTVNEKKFDPQWEKDYTIRKINQIGATIYFALFQKDNQEIEINAEEIKLPEISLSQAISKRKQIENELAELENKFDSLAQNKITTLENCKLQLREKYQFENAAANTENSIEGRVLVLQGWVPTTRVKKLKQYLEENKILYLVESPQEGDDVPVLLKNKPFPKLFEPIIKLFSLPNYIELDPTPFVAPFFAIFFGLCLGDLGYGLLIILICLSVLPKTNKSMRPILHLGFVLGLLTAISGVLLNTFFGQAIFGGEGVENAFFSSGAKFFAPLGSLETDKGTVFPAMSLSLVLGFIQVIIGMLLNAANNIRQKGWAYGIQPISYILMIIGGLVLGAHTNFLDLGIPDFSVGRVQIGILLVSVPKIIGTILLYGGLFLLIFFNSPDKNIGARIGLGLYELYNFITGLMSDILSYLRLFALGLASGLLGNAFNQIAFMLVETDTGFNYASPMIIFTLLILVFGHTLNFGLSALGSFVHPLRLTFVEFYKNIGFQGGSKPYFPFAKIEENV